MPRKSGEAEERFEITGDLERPAAEALELELRRLARRHGVELEQVRIEPVGRRAPRRSA